MPFLPSLLITILSFLLLSGTILIVDATSISSCVAPWSTGLSASRNASCWQTISHHQETQQPSTWITLSTKLSPYSTLSSVPERSTFSALTTSIALLVGSETAFLSISQAASRSLAGNASLSNVKVPIIATPASSVRSVSSGPRTLPASSAHLSYWWTNESISQVSHVHGQ